PTPPRGGSPAPGGPPLVPPLVAGTHFTGAAGYQLECDPNLWTITDQNDSDVSLELSLNGIAAEVQIRSQAAGSSDDDAVSARADALGADVLGLAKDNKPADQVLEPSVG